MSELLLNSSDSVITEDEVGQGILITAGKIQNIVDLTLRKDITTEAAIINLDRILDSLKSQVRTFGNFSQQTREPSEIVNMEAVADTNNKSVITQIRNLLLAKRNSVTSSSSTHQTTDGREALQPSLLSTAPYGSSSCISSKGNSLNGVGSAALNSNAIEQFPEKLPPAVDRNDQVSDEDAPTHEMAKRRRLSVKCGHPAHHVSLPQPYQCMICPKRFLNITACKRHQLTHTKPFVCTYCDHRSAERNKIRLHCIKRHGDADLFTEEDHVEGGRLRNAKENKNVSAEKKLGDASDEDLKIDERVMRTKSNNMKVAQSSTVVIVKAESDDSNDPLFPVITGVGSLAETLCDVKFITMEDMVDSMQFVDERSDDEDYTEKPEKYAFSSMGADS